MADFQNFILTVASSLLEILSSLSKILSKYLKDEYEIIVYNLSDPRTYIWFGLAFIFKLLEIILKSYSNHYK